MQSSVSVVSGRSFLQQALFQTTNAHRAKVHLTGAFLGPFWARSGARLATPSLEPTFAGSVTAFERLGVLAWVGFGWGLGGEGTAVRLTCVELNFNFATWLCRPRRACEALTINKVQSYIKALPPLLVVPITLGPQKGK